MMSKVHKSFRLDEEITAAVSTLATEGESEAATYARVIQAGIQFLKGKEAQHTSEAAQGRDDRNAALIASLQSHIETLRASNEELSGQLSIKDEQIRALSVLTAQAQELYGMATKTIEQPKDASKVGGQEKRRGFWARLFS